MALGQDEIGRRIAQARDEVEPRLTQRQLADRIGVDPVTISRFERGRAPVSIRWLRRIAEATGKPIGYFVQEESVPKIGSPITPYLEDMIRRIVELGPESLNDHRELLQTMLDSLRESARETLEFVAEVEALIAAAETAGS